MKLFSKCKLQIKQLLRSGQFHNSGKAALLTFFEKEILGDYSRGDSIRMIALEYGVNFSTVHRFIVGKAR